MSVASVNLPSTRLEQRLVLPKTYDWQEFEALEQLLSESSELRFTSLDGWIELMTLGESHELIQSLLGIFVETYLIAMEIEFIPAGSATRRGEEKSTSFHRSLQLTQILHQRQRLAVDETKLTRQS
ncbi:MAG: hypothetical protein ACFCU8_06345 [Thermosynechococcaceae cyanobacterium]